MFSYQWGPSIISLEWSACILLVEYKYCVLKFSKLNNTRYDKGVQVKLHLDREARPHFHKPQSVPYALCQKVEQEPDSLIDDGAIVPM